MRSSTQNLGPIGSAVLSFIGYKQRGRQTNNKQVYIYNIEAHVQKKKLLKQAVLTLCQIWTLKKIMPKTIQKRTNGMPITLNISTIYIYFTREGVLKTLKRLEERILWSMAKIWVHFIKGTNLGSRSDPDYSRKISRVPLWIGKLRLKNRYILLILFPMPSLVKNVLITPIQCPRVSP